MTAININSENLSFVVYDQTFLDASYKWLQNPKLRHLTNTPPVERAKQLEWFATLPERHDYLIWGISLNGVAIGACGLKHVDQQQAEYWGYIGLEEFWGKGLGRQIVEFCLREAKKRSLQRIWLTVNADNKRAIALYEKTGFVTINSNNGNLIMEQDINCSRLDLCRILEFPKVTDQRGNLSFIESERHIPFTLKRVYYL